MPYSNQSVVRIGWNSGRSPTPSRRMAGAGCESGLVSEGDTVVITAGTAVNIPGSTNVIKVDVA